MVFITKKEYMTEDEYGLLRDLISREFGIQLKGDKRLTVHAKVSHRLSILGLSSYREYYEYITSDPKREELYIFASHITNNETYFFREKPQLDLFAELLAEIKKVRQARGENVLEVLSLASSTGEEAYTINIIIHESGLFTWDWKVRITGIDIDNEALRKAREASYAKNSFRTFNGDMSVANRYFTPEGDRFMLRRSLANNVEFRHGNLIDPAAFAGIHGVDVIFCRNVLIYMSDEAIEKIVANLYNALSDTGYLFIGSSESLIQRTNLFLPEYRGGIIVYRKNVGL